MDMKTNITYQTPRAKWAQDAVSIFLTICLEDCKNPKVIFTEQDLTFQSLSGPKSTPYKIEMMLFKEIIPQESRYVVRDREIEILLKKKEQGSPYWNRLIKDKAKQHWLRIDFERWKEEDESEEEDSDKELDEEELREKRYGPKPLDFKDHIADNVSKGSSLCPLGSAMMGKAMKMEEGLNEISKKKGGSKKTSFDIHGFDAEAPDSDDEILSDIEEPLSVSDLKTSLIR